MVWRQWSESEDVVCVFVSVSLGRWVLLVPIYPKVFSVKSDQKRRGGGGEFNEPPIPVCVYVFKESV